MSISSFSTLSVILFAIAYLIMIDRNISDYIILKLKMIELNVERMFWMIRLHPKNPVTNIMMKYRCHQMAKQIQKEFEAKNEIVENKVEY